jgi:hypothetical protein
LLILGLGGAETLNAMMREIAGEILSTRVMMGYLNSILIAGDECSLEDEKKHNSVSESSIPTPQNGGAYMDAIGG